MRFLLLAAVVSGLTACSVRAPELDASITTQSRNADWPELVPLGPLLAETDGFDLTRAENTGQTLERRAADLRRRAAILRRLSIN